MPVLPTHSRQSWCSSQPTCSHSPAPPGLHVLHFGELRPTGCFEGSHRATYIAALPEAIRREPNTCIPCCLVVLLHGLVSWQPCHVPASTGTRRERSESSQHAFGLPGKGNAGCLMVLIRASWDVTNFWSAK